MSTAGKLAWGFILLLGILHWDFWFWDDRSFVFGFLPIGLAYHALFSIAAGVVWASAVKFVWPSDLEAWADEFDEPPRGQGSEGEEG